ncbi:hypothetical protein ARMGADRAFT_1035321 [Armillaria gallica]|uniref:Uncharacterized protein n=1 Tax=Armillaria gallica TaxID=47427 RepID=A0A2H3DH37_ARMGA|nr:hypothetical protein ARMGADRAFT_1035321 [Armillaria gallica]
MALSHVLCDMRHIPTMLDKLSTTIVKGTTICTQDDASKTCQLSRFFDHTLLPTEFGVSAPGIDYRHFLTWNSSQEEVVLNVQGVVVEVYLPPVIHAKNPKCDTFQMIKVSAPIQDKQFTCAYQAIMNIYSFMLHYDKHITPLEHNVVCNMPAIRADCKLMNNQSHNWDDIIDLRSTVDPDGLMKAYIDRGDYVYTEDNAVQFFEWKSEDKHSIKPIHPGTIKAGDIVDLGLSFRLITVNSGVRFQVKLDSVTVINHSGVEILDSLAYTESTSSKQTIVRPPKKRQDNGTFRIIINSNVLLSLEKIVVQMSTENCGHI